MNITIQVLSLTLFRFLWYLVTGEDHRFKKFNCSKDEQSFQRKSWVSFRPVWVPGSLCHGGKSYSFLWIFVHSFMVFFFFLLLIEKCTLISCTMFGLQELEKLLDILKHAHELLSKDISIDSFNLMLNEMLENLSLVSFSSRLASQVWNFFLSLLFLLDISIVNFLTCWSNVYPCKYLPPKMDN